MSSFKRLGRGICMEFYSNYQRQLRFAVLIILIVILQGCGNEKSVLNKDAKALEKEEESYEEMTEKNGNLVMN